MRRARLPYARLLLRPLNLEAMRGDLDHQPAADGYVLAADIHRRVAQAAQ